ncbi:MAG: hypothetical protein ACFFCI_16050 [Promethearchaeota archaeon]
MSEKKKEHIFFEMIEKILFDERELEILKSLITDVSTGKIPPKKLKLAIIENRARIINRISHIFPFYYKQLTNQREIDNFTYNGNISNVENELEEKNKFLEELGEKLYTIKTKLLQNNIK